MLLCIGAFSHPQELMVVVDVFQDQLIKLWELKNHKRQVFTPKSIWQSFKILHALTTLVRHADYEVFVAKVMNHLMTSVMRDWQTLVSLTWKGFSLVGH
jgi:hypothetical protein